MYFIVVQDKNTNINISDLSCNNSFYKKFSSRNLQKNSFAILYSIIIYYCDLLILRSKVNLNYKYFKIKIFLLGHNSNIFSNFG